MQPLISIILPTYNSKKYISDTIISILSQTYKNYEVLIIDDHSNDETLSFLKRNFTSTKLRYINKKNYPRGVSYSRKLGFEKSNGDYICFLDSDDTWDKDKLKKQINFMVCNNYLFTCTSVIRKKSNSTKLFVPPANLDFQQLQKTNSIHTSSVMIKRNIIKNIDFVHLGYDDFILWLNIMKRDIKCHNLNEPLCEYKVNVENSLSSNYLRALYWNVLIQLKIIKPGFFKFLVNISSYILNAYLKRINYE